MSTFNLNIEDCNKNKFPIELILGGNEIYNGIVKLAKYSAGVIALVPIGIASIIVLPITYFILAIIFIFYLYRITRSTSKILQLVADKDNYKDLYDLYLFSNRTNSELSKIESVSKDSAKGWLIRPFFFFLKKFHVEVLKVNQHLEEQLFEESNSESASVEDIEFFRAQLKNVEHDWNDDELWKNFQNKHHHISN
jgi:hypothetical protein